MEAHPLQVVQHARHGADGAEQEAAGAAGHDVGAVAGGAEGIEEAWGECSIP